MVALFTKPLKLKILPNKSLLFLYQSAGTSFSENLSSHFCNFFFSSYEKKFELIIRLKVLEMLIINSLSTQCKIIIILMMMTMKIIALVIKNLMKETVKESLNLCGCVSIKIYTVHRVLRNSKGGSRSFSGCVATRAFRGVLGNRWRRRIYPECKRACQHCAT